jgi:TIR domain
MDDVILDAGGAELLQQCGEQGGGGGGGGRLRLCVHERDFPPGQEIIGNIWNKMECSRKVILVISKNFTLSHYCDYEMNLARMQSVEQGRNVLVPVILEYPDVNSVSECLHWVLKNVTYVEWPRDNNGDRDDFWQHLRRSIAS